MLNVQEMVGQMEKHLKCVRDSKGSLEKCSSWSWLAIAAVYDFGKKFF